MSDFGTAALDLRSLFQKTNRVLEQAYLPNKP